MAAPAQGGRLMTLFKRGWNEIPEVVGSSFIALIGVGLGFTGLYNYNRKDGDNRRYKDKYIVLRPDDPRVDRIRKD